MVFPLITKSVLNNSLQLQIKCCCSNESMWSRTLTWPEQSRKRSYLQVVLCKPRCKRCARISQVKRKKQVKRLFFPTDWRTGMRVFSTFIELIEGWNVRREEKCKDWRGKWWLQRPCISISNWPLKKLIKILTNAHGQNSDSIIDAINKLLEMQPPKNEYL